MAADQERNRKIAEALGALFYEGWEPSEATTYLRANHVRVTLNGAVLFESWQEEGRNKVHVGTDWPDFSLPEWQIKIQEMVRKLWSGPEVFMSYEYCRFPPRIHRIYLWTEDTNPKLVVSGGSSQVVWEDVLLWLAEREVKHD